MAIRDIPRSTRDSALRDGLAWLSFPILMGGFVALAAWGLARGFPPGPWGAALTVANFFVILAVEQWLPRDPATSVFRDRQSLRDIGHGLLLTAARPLGGAACVALLAGLGALRERAPLASAWPTSLPFALDFALAFLVWTFSDYWVHRSLHRFDRLWWFHAIHHDTPQMHILKSGRIHLGEELINATLKPIPLLLLGAPVEVLVLLGMWTVFDGNLVHSNIAQCFPSFAHYFLPTVQLHNLHHTQDRRTQDSNFCGSSAIWDVLFGTFSHPGRVPLGALGLEASPVPRGFLAQLAFPFRQQLALAAAAQSLRSRARVDARPGSL
jgi:sterol desaturase/sphingolipid hydroxylase (fatty acid hydroxylase superfamily)